MKLFHDTEKALEIEEKLVTIFEEESEERNQVHLSDTGYCPMKTYCRLIGIIPLPFTKKAIGKMTIGKVGQLIIQQLFKEEYREVEHDGLPSHVDILEGGKVPIEVKYSASRIFRASDVPTGWVMQLMGYMALHNSTVGWLLIMNLFSGQWIAFKMMMSLEELEDHRKFLEEFDSTITKAAETEDYKLIFDLIERRFETEEDRFKTCGYCDYRPGRKRKKLDLGEGCPLYKKSLTAMVQLSLPK
jgi:hypothetical protein